MAVQTNMSFPVSLLEWPVAREARVGVSQDTQLSVQKAPGTRYPLWLPTRLLLPFASFSLCADRRDRGTGPGLVRIMGMHFCLR